MAEDHPAMRAPARKPHASMEKRRNSCEARPGLIESTHIAPLNEGLMAEDHEAMGMTGKSLGQMRDDMAGMKDMHQAHPLGHGDTEAVKESFMRHSLR